jgi:hypothetical protein
MKNIKKILSEFGVELTDEQETQISQAVAENYKTIAEFDKLNKKLETSKTENDNLAQQLDDAKKTIQGFDGVDIEKLNSDIAEWKKRAEDAESNAKTQLLQRDQRDYLKAEFDNLGINSERIRKSLADDIMGDDGLKWKDGAYMGLSDYLAKENEKEHFYLTEEEKEAQKAAEDSKKNVPKISEKTDGNVQIPVKKVIPKIW